jgi:hypothetical protein
MKPVVIYERGEIKVYINQCHNPGKKTKIFAIRRNDSHGRAQLLGIIKFDGAWRQYVTEYETNTKWCANCEEEIAKFKRELNKKLREKWSRLKNQ